MRSVYHDPGERLKAASPPAISTAFEPLISLITDRVGEERWKTSSHLVNSFKLQPVQAKLRMPFSFLHAKHRFSTKQIVEGALGNIGGVS